MVLQLKGTLTLFCYGHAYEDSLTRKRERIEILLLLNALAIFVAWLAGIAAEHQGCSRRLATCRRERRTYSLIRVGWEALQRRWVKRPVHTMFERLRALTPEAMGNMAAWS